MIDYLLDVPASVALIQHLNGRGDELCSCDVVIAEVYSGVRPENSGAAEAFIEALTFVASTPQAARQAGIWRYEYARPGIALSVPDMLIAATAYVNNMTIVTGNKAHYPIAELSLLPLPRGRRDE